jgi:cyclopropane fatty-acyl-phospholipid synthase-like methyltransferase
VLSPQAFRFQDLYTTGDYAASNPGWHIEESPWKARHILRLLSKHQLTPRTVCEVGCGAGEVLAQLQRHMAPETRFTGYEISPHAITLCQARANARLDFRLADITQEPGGDYDLLLLLDVVEHLEDYFSFLRALRPKSRSTLFHFPLDLSVQTVLRRQALLKRRRIHAHLHYFSKETALQTLCDVGYEIVDYAYGARSNELRTEPLQRLLRVPRGLLFALDRDSAQRLLGGYSLFVLAR